VERRAPADPEPRNGNYKHGRSTAEAKQRHLQLRQWIRNQLSETRALMKRLHDLTAASRKQLQSCPLKAIGVVAMAGVLTISNGDNQPRAYWMELSTRGKDPTTGESRNNGTRPHAPR
jgi:hypothetical protein